MEGKLKIVQDVVFYTTIGIFFTVLLLSIAIFFLPYYVGREVWYRWEVWYMNR